MFNNEIITNITNPCMVTILSNVPMLIHGRILNILARTSTKKLGMSSLVLNRFPLTDLLFFFRYKIKVYRKKKSQLKISTQLSEYYNKTEMSRVK